MDRIVVVPVADVEEKMKREDSGGGEGEHPVHRIELLAATRENQASHEVAVYLFVLEAPLVEEGGLKQGVHFHLGDP